MNPFREITARLRSTVTGDVSPDGDAIAVKAGLGRLLHSDDWSPDDWTFVDQVSKKLDTTRRLYDSYSQQWSRTSTMEIGEPWRSVFALALCNALYFQLEEGPGNPTVLKRFNVALKAIDYLDNVAPKEATDLGDALRTVEFTFEGKAVAATPVKVSKTVSHAQGILPLTVLFSEGPIARAYLETIASLGLRPRKIVHLVSSVDVATGRKILRWVPTALRKAIAAGMQRSRIFHWPNALARRYPNDVSEIVSSVADNFCFAEETLRQAQLNKPLVEYSPSVETLLVENLKDPALLEYLNSETDREFLFTGGGIVPRSLLDVRDSRFIHVHPGFLPDIRGADGLLWSVLTRSRPSASAFYMAPGIDTGDILTTRWLPEIDVRINGSIDVLTRYRMAYAFIDPWVRCRVLRELLENHAEFGKIPATAQNETDGCTYHFMHDRLRAMALNKLFARK